MLSVEGLGFMVYGEVFESPKRSCPPSSSRSSIPGIGFRVEGSGLKVEGIWALAPLRFRVSGFGFWVSGLGFRVQGSGVIQGVGFRASGLGYSRSGLRVEGKGFKV